MRINARLDEEHANKLAYIQQQTNRSITETIKTAIDLYYQEIQKEQKNPSQLMIQTGFIGCGNADSNLSKSYKSFLEEELKTKYGHC
ncbi:MAG: CopG family transcriptional regulator [Hydrococcus sp. RU_2_2]|jgi:hypothetical protein|nr:CopG family transcriptional regulator [Hydrococcus sp. RU_2_2]NJP18435.1 CopG family transcriptional regulator [Hydrococcus sp. CRU_1_1]